MANYIKVIRKRISTKAFAGNVSWVNMRNFVISTQRKKRHDARSKSHLTYVKKTNLKASDICAPAQGLAMHAPTLAQSHISQAVAAIDNCLPLVMADTARVIWLCACVSYRPSRGLVYVCHLPLSLS